MATDDILPAIEIAITSSFENEPSNTEYKFGDGYSQSVGNGLSNDLEKINVQYLDRSQAEMETLLAFFKQLGGRGFFMWTPPPYKDASGNSNPARKFICKKWKKSPSGGVTWNIDCVFEETANLS